MITPTSLDPCYSTMWSTERKRRLNSAIGFGPWRSQRFNWSIPRFVRYTKKLCFGNGILVSSGTVYRAKQAKILHSRRGNQRITWCSWCLERSGQRRTCILQFYEGDISIPWQLVTQPVQEYFRCKTLWLAPSRKGRSLQVLLEYTKKNEPRIFSR